MLSALLYFFVLISQMHRRMPAAKDRNSPIRRYLHHPSKIWPLLAASFLAAIVLDVSYRVMYRNRCSYSGIDMDADPEDALVALRSMQQKIHSGSTGNIVLATAPFETDIEKLAIFLGSWGYHSPGTKIIIFTAQNLLEDSFVRSLYSEFEVEARPYDPPPEKDDPDDEEELSKPGRAVLYTYEQYQLLLDTEIHSAKGVAVVIDVNEVALQADIFLDGAVRSAVSHNQVLLTQEGGSELLNVPVNTSKATYNASRDCYGTGIADKMGPKSTMSPTFAIGGRNGVREYVALMADILGTRVRFKCLKSPRPDIAVLTYVVYILGSDKHYLDFRIFLRSGINSPILSMTYGLPAYIDGRGVVHRHRMPNYQGKFLATPSVLTRYEEHPFMLDFLLKRYAPAMAELDFVQVPHGYVGTNELLTGLPPSWALAAKKSWSYMRRGNNANIDINDVVDSMATGATEKRKKVELNRESQSN